MGYSEKADTFSPNIVIDGLLFGHKTLKEGHISLNGKISRFFEVEKPLEILQNIE